MSFLNAISYYTEHKTELRSILDELIERSRPEPDDEPAYTFAAMVQALQADPGHAVTVAALSVMRLAQRDEERARLASAVAWAAEEYRRCIISARVTIDGHHYAKCNGRAEAYRQLCEQLATAADLPAPDWEQIKKDVPAGGIYRASTQGGAAC